MPRTITGLRIRERRREQGLAQTTLAKRVGVSPSYLNLIERNKRRIAGGLLTRIARELDVDIAELDGSVERRLHEELLDVAADPDLAASDIAMASPPPAAVGELIARFPEWSRWLAHCHREFQAAHNLAEALSQRLSQDPFLSEAVHNMLTEIAALGSTAQILVDVPVIDEVQRRRFEQNIAAQAAKLALTGRSLADYFDVEVARRRTVRPAMAADAWHLDHRSAILALEKKLQVRLHQQHGARFPLTPYDIHQLRSALDERDAGPHRADQSETLSALVQTNLASDLDQLWKTLPNSEATDLIRQRVIEQLADSLRLPTEILRQSDHTDPLDLESLAALAGLDIAVVMRRLAQLAGDDGPMLGLLSADAAGRTIQRCHLPAALAAVSEFSCSKWILHQAAATPGRLVTQSVALNGVEQYVFQAFASTVSLQTMGRQQIARIDMLIAPLGTVPVDPTEPVEFVGANCRVCAAVDCAFRHEPPVVSTG